MANSEAETSQSSQVTTEHGHTGKYEVLLELGSGGSATVSVAVSRGIAGFSKVVVLKAIREGLDHDEDTIKMFLVEARLSARMSHPNVVQVYEVFKQNRLPVIVMEYVDGQSFAMLRRRQAASGERAPEIGIAILAKTLAGLHYAHTLSDYSGEPLHLVHRDVSPHNVMIGYDGQVKLVDFGIAKLKNQHVHTRTGVIKGKLNYMAPEQVRGEVDHRADIFAVGVMLWEIITGARLWGGAGDATIISRLLHGDVTPVREVAPDVDPEIEHICSKALAVDVEQRYANAAEMQAALEAYLARRGVDTSQAAIGAAVARACPELRERTRAALGEKMRGLGMSATASLDLSEVSEAPAAAVAAAPAQAARRRAVGPIVAAVALAGALFGAAAGGGALSSRPAGAASPQPMAAPAALSAPSSAPAPALAASAAAPERIKLSVTVSPADAELYLDDRRLSTNPFVDTLPSDSEAHTFRASAKGFEPFTKALRLDSDLDLLVALKPVRAAPAPARPRARPSAARALANPPPAPAAPAREVPHEQEEAPSAAPAPRPRPLAPGEDLRAPRPAEERARGQVQFENPYTR